MPGPRYPHHQRGTSSAGRGAGPDGDKSEMLRSFHFGRRAPLALVLMAPFAVRAEAAAANSGDTAWLLTATALVLFMTLPGLAAFYAGLVRSKNALSVIMQCFAI